MRLCIADPPYLGVAGKWYGPGTGSFCMQRGAIARSDENSEAAVWDDPATHRALIERLCADYDGWAVAMAWYNLREYMQWVPADIWIGIWVKPNAVPSRSRLVNCWEPVIVRPPSGRRAVDGPGQTIRGVLTANVPGHFVGAKPPQWTRWVLDMLGYDPETDTVDDLFHGSGAVAAEIAQGVLL